MITVILDDKDLSNFLNYCVSWGFSATVVNRIYPFLDHPQKFVFRMDRDFTKCDFSVIAAYTPSLKYYEI